MTEYGLMDKTRMENIIIACYFAFTTLSTVGFGDYNPKSDVERILCSVILLFGVTLFSYFMGNLSEIIDKIRMFDEVINEDF